MRESTKTIGRGPLVAEIDIENSHMLGFASNGRGILRSLPAEGAVRFPEEILFPMVGRASAGKILLNGAEISMAENGMVKGLQWQTLDLTANYAKMLLHYKGDQAESLDAGGDMAHGRGTASSFPMEVTLTKSYSIEEERGKQVLVLRLDVSAGSEAMPYAAGWELALSAVNGCSIVAQTGKLTVSMLQENIADGEDNSVFFAGTNVIDYGKNGDYGVLISHTFGNTLVTNKKDGSVLVAPITADPVSLLASSDTRELDRVEGYRTLRRGQTDHFEIRIRVERVGCG